MEGVSTEETSRVLISCVSSEAICSHGHEMATCLSPCTVPHMEHLVTVPPVPSLNETCKYCHLTTHQLSPVFKTELFPIPARRLQESQSPACPSHLRGSEDPRGMHSSSRGQTYVSLSRCPGPCSSPSVSSGCPIAETQACLLFPQNIIKTNL